MQTSFALSQFKKSKLLRGFALLFAAVLLSCEAANAQMPLSNVVFTVGTTVRDTANHDWSFVLIGSPQPGLLAGKKFAIYGKPGTSTNAATLTYRGNVFQQSDPIAINALLQISVSVGQNLSTLQNGLVGTLGTRVPNAANTQTVAQNVLSAFQIAVTDPNVAQSLQLAGGGNPGLNMCLCRAFAEQITGVTTYEIRDVNPVTGAAGEVVGRVTITPGAHRYCPLPARLFKSLRIIFRTICGSVSDGASPIPCCGCRCLITDSTSGGFRRQSLKQQATMSRRHLRPS